MKILVSLITLCLFVFSASASASAEDVVREETITAALNAGEKIQIDNINGDISVEGWSSDEVEVVYTITCDNQEDMDAIEVVCDLDDGISCEVNYEEDWYRNHSGEVNFQIRVPSSQILKYELCDVNGDVSISSAAGSVILEVVNGEIDASEFTGEMTVELVNGSVTTSAVTDLQKVEIVNGSISCSIDQMGSDLSLSSVNGEIEVKLTTDASVEIETLNGDIEIASSFNPHIAEDIVGSSASFGNGEYNLEISAVSGDVEITD